MFDPAGQAERPREIGGDGDDVEFGEALLKLGRALFEIIAGNVDGHIGRRRNRL